MSLNVNTEKWGEIQDWRTNTITGNYFTYPWSRRTWTQIAEQGYQQVNQELDFSIAPWWIGPSAWNQRNMAFWYNDRYTPSGEEGDRTEANKAHKSTFALTYGAPATPFMLSYHGTSGTSFMKNLTTYWAYQINDKMDATTNIGNRYPISNFRYDKIRICPCIWMAEDDPDTEDGAINLSKTQFGGFPSQSDIAANPFCVNFGFEIWIDKNGTWTEVPMTVEIPLEIEGDDGIENYFSGSTGIKVLTTPTMANLAGTHYNNMMWKNNPSDSMNTSGYSRGEQNAKNFSFSFANMTATTNAALHAMEYGDVPGYSLSERLYEGNQTVFQGQYYTRVTDRDSWMETIKRQLAYIGLPMVWSRAQVSTATLDNGQLYLPVFDASRATTGNYVTGDAAKALPNSTWQWIYNIDPLPDYKPDADPDAPVPDTGSGNVLPEGLQFTLANRGTGIWALTPSDIDEIWGDIFGGDIKVDMFGTNPMNAILSLKWTPFIWNPVGDPSPIVLGDQIVNPLHTYPIIATLGNAEQHGTGGATFEFDKNFYNARHMQARLFLPFYGYYELPASQLLSSAIRLDFYYNVPDELGVWYISYKQEGSTDWVFYDYCECAIDIEIPLTGSNAAAISANRKAEALSIATQVASLAVQGAVLASGVSVVGGELGAIYSGAGSIGGVASSLPWLEGETWGNIGRGALRGLSGGSGVLGGLQGLSNTMVNARIERANLKTNLPYHGSALQTTFLHLPMEPFIQIFKNGIMEGLETEHTNTVEEKLGGQTEAQYKLKVGHACDVWNTIDEMPENSLLQTTGMADMSAMGMELAEVQEFNTILMNGFYYTKWW